jgi:hypothetical protein
MSSPSPHDCAAWVIVTSVIGGWYFLKSDSSLTISLPGWLGSFQDSDRGGGRGRPSPLFNLPKNSAACPITPGKSGILRQSRLKLSGPAALQSPENVLDKAAERFVDRVWICLRINGARNDELIVRKVYAADILLRLVNYRHKAKSP